MKKMIFFMALAMTLTAAQAQIRIGGKSINLDKATQAVSKVAKAVTLSDTDIYNLCHESVEWMDKHNEVAKDNSEYAKRLARLTKDFKEVNGMPLNFKVYLVTDINAFASGDGSVRVFSSLMDIMDDDELMGVIGHELGHVANTDVKDAMKQAYMTAGLIDAASAVSNTANRLSDTQLNKLTQAFLSAQFSQKQESAADEYGIKKCVELGFDPYGLANGLQKLADLSGGAKQSAVQKMFSSHPDDGKRVARAKTLAEKYGKASSKKK